MKRGESRGGEKGESRKKRRNKRGVGHSMSEKKM
jgi:hypothetical protein